MQKLFSFLCALLLGVCFLTGCTISKELTGQTRIITDDAGREIRVPLHPKRIMSLTYGTDEILMDIVEPNRIVALSKYAGDTDITFVTPEMRDQVGRTIDLEPESIISLNPDLVIASISVPAQTVKLLSDSGIPVYMSGIAYDYKGIESKVRGVAKAVHEEDRGEQMVQAMNDRLAALEDKLSGITPDKERVALGLSWRGILGKKGTLFCDVLERAHVKDGASVYTVPKGADAYLSNELLPKINPDVILLPVWRVKDGDDQEKFAHDLASNPAFQDVKAVKEGHLIPFPEKYKYVMSHHVVDAIEAAAKAVYPEVFENG